MAAPLWKSSCVTETLYNNTAAQHVGKARNALAVAVAVLKRLGEMLGYQQGEVGALGLLGRILIAVSVYGYNAVGVLRDCS